MTDNEIYIIGAGGHAKVVANSARAAGFAVAAMFDDDENLWGRSLLGIPIHGPISRIREFPAKPAIAAIGDNANRFAIVSAASLDWRTVIDPAAHVDSSVVVGIGTAILPGAVVQIDSRIGKHAIVNTSASIDHDCAIGDYVHLAPGVHLAGNVRVGEGAFIGIGAAVIPGITIGAGAVVGAGAAVICDIPDRAVVVGVPARVKSFRAAFPFGK
jgi:sugar O-acyltransferase (sialic acid O-acetyltransferase NeuD family)